MEGGKRNIRRTRIIRVEVIRKDTIALTLI